MTNPGRPANFIPSTTKDRTMRQKNAAEESSMSRASIWNLSGAEICKVSQAIFKRVK
jgi:hypothetical protein